jgi:adenosylcobinamide-GDP ribazoletransferase
VFVEERPPLAAVRGVRAALVSFSRVPVGGYPYLEQEWRWAAAHLPLIGALIGAASAGVWKLAHAAQLGSLLPAILAVATSTWLSGALHEDGLADAADGLGGAHGGARALEIMKDSRIGSYGALAIGFSLLMRVAALAELDDEHWWMLVLIHCLARVGPVWLMWSQPYVSDAASAKSPAFLPIGRAQLAVALGWAGLATLLGIFGGGMGWVGSLAVLLVLAALSVLAARYFRRAVGGITGDLLGAVEQVGEIAAWLTWLGCRGL